MLLAFLTPGLILSAQRANNPSIGQAVERSPANAGIPAGPDFDGPPPFGPGGPDPGSDGPPPFGPGGFGRGGFGPGGPGGKMQEMKLVKQFDKNGDGWLNAEERKAAREFLNKQGGGRRFGGPGGRRGGFGPPGGNEQPPQPGQKLTPADVKAYPDAPLYASNVLRTLFLEFEDADWEKELAEFKNTDVEVPAKLTVDRMVYPDVGVRFHGASSFFMLGEGQKRSLVVSLDYVHKDQKLAGYRKLNLLNSHEDPSFLHTVLGLQIARDYLPAPKANHVRVVINGESWGVYVNQQHFNKEFVKEWFGTTKGARWKVPGSPNGHGGFNYVGEDVAAYKSIYEIKSKDDPQSWAALVNLFKVLNQTPSDQLVQKLTPLLDLDGALKFLAWENVLANGDGFYTRASDYDLYEDTKGQFHIIPYDVNEVFSAGGGPGGPGGPGGFGGRGGPSGFEGRGGRGGFGPGMFLAPQILEQADQNKDGKIAQAEFVALADTWFDKLDSDKTDKVSSEQFLERLSNLFSSPQGPDGFGPPDGGGPGGIRGGFGPARFIGPSLFTALDTNKDGSLTRTEIKDTFAKWFTEWDSAKAGTLSEESLRTGLSAALPRPNFGGPRGGFGGPGGMGGMGGMRAGGGRGGFGGPFGGGGVQLDPLIAANDSSKPLLSKLLAVPTLRTRYLGYVRDIAAKWLDWSKLGPVAEQYHSLIAADVQSDTRKLDTTEAFLSSLGAVGSEQANLGGRQEASLKSFADQRRAFLLNYAEAKKN